ncbi:MAG: DNA polymerase IV [Firmicutes bacterium]|nr:DNA polymerase IV [Bacillota bacterium]
MGRVILHCDLNNYYASVEALLDPRLREVPLAVCGDPESRHGVVLAKNQIAKGYGVLTGEALWQAKRKCPGLVCVLAHHRIYEEYAARVRAIYCRYTDQVEPFGIDECWLDVTGSRRLFGSGFEIAERLRREVREEIGLTISVGVSFNKAFAKLGSDLKKPDATSCITEANFREVVWPLPAAYLLFVGGATAKKLADCGIRTIGDVARQRSRHLQHLLGKHGVRLWQYANGIDNDPVRLFTDHRPPKSISHGVTCREDLTHADEVWPIFRHLAQDIGRKLRAEQMQAATVQISLKGASLQVKQYQAPLPEPTRSPQLIAEAAQALLIKHYRWAEPLRAVTVAATNLTQGKAPRQLLLFADERPEKLDKVEDVMYGLQERFGGQALFSAAELLADKLPRHREELPEEEES